MISMDLPDMAICTSPGFCAFPDGIFSEAQTTEMTFTLGAIGQRGRRHAVARLVHQLAGKILRFAEDAGFLQRALERFLVAIGGRDHGELLDALIFAV